MNEGIPRKSTIEDVAHLAGVSIATVSRTVHRPDSVAVKTRELVLSAIRETDYTPNAAAGNLRRRRANAVLALVPDVGNTFFSEILAGIERIAWRAGLTLLIGNAANDPAREADYLNLIASGRADGALLLNGRLATGPTARGGRTRVPDARSLALVSVCERIAATGLVHVGIDNVAAARTAVEHLLDLGHRRIAFVAGPADNVLTRDRLEGYRASLACAGVAPERGLELAGDFSAASGELAAREWLAMTSAPRAVFCANDEMAMGFVRVLHNHSLRVPRDCSVIGFDDIAFARTFIPALTTIRQPRGEIGARAMQALIDRIEGRARPSTRKLLLAHELIVRESTAPLRSRA